MKGISLLYLALWLVLLFHGTLVFGQSFVRTYDALIHIFFASHYAQNWFDPWESRWYTGFSLVSYPPLSHYMIALLSKLLDLKTAFAYVQLFALLNLTVGVFRFSRLLGSEVAAGYAAIMLALSSAIAETVHVFGQLPTTLSIGFLLNAVPFAEAYVRQGRRVDLFRAVAWTATTTAGHHITTLFGSVFFIAPVLLIPVLEAWRMERPKERQGPRLFDQIRRRLYRIAPRFYRAALYGALAIVMLVVVVLPYWIWAKSDPITQVPIPHGSRENFLIRTDFGLMFWLIPWASSLIFLPYAFYKGIGRLWPVVASLALLTLLGTGGTTPLPKMLLRGAFDILTLDRFTFWATILILPFCGMALESLLHGRLGKYVTANWGSRVRLGMMAAGLVSLSATDILISNLTRYRKFQPAEIDPAPIVNFIEKDEHWRYRYLTLGFGDQMAWLSANTRASTPDGNYHSARRLPELTTTPVERLEGAKYTGVPGIGSLTQFLITPEKYNLKFIYSNDAFYDPLLHFTGWRSLNQLENGVQVWERGDIPPLPERLPRREMGLALRLMWGILPILAPIFAFLSLIFPQSFLSKGLRYSLLIDDATVLHPPTAWQPWRNWIPKLRLERFLNFERRPLKLRLIWTAALSLALCAFGMSVYFKLRTPKTPEQAVIGYWDALDFKRFEAAYRYIFPTNGLDYERWKLDLSVQGGLRSGYAKLDSIHTLSSSVSGNRATVQVKLDWLTSLGMISETMEHTLRETPGGWKLVTRPTLNVRQARRFFSQADAKYYQSPRRLTTDVTSSFDILDRPKVEVTQSRLIVYRQGKDWQYAIVGWLENRDARPADLTVTGILRDSQGREITHFNAGEGMIHQLRPGQSTPFQIDFIGVSAPPPNTTVAQFEVSAKALVTATGLQDRFYLWVQPLTPIKNAIRVGNLGTLEATLTQLYVPIWDADGLAFLTRKYLMESIPPREERRLEMDVALPPGYRVLLRKGKGQVLPFKVLASAYYRN